ncbi:hypothetical protein [Streptomyces sp. NPDC057552]|uniref:hypothetical protein n=1 Tax=Streptomyces sp. NPDC057552 TaxID=3350537 RepID=UPI0036D004BD
MGAIQEPTPEMGPYRVEMRSESFYLTRTEADAETTAARTRYEAKVPTADLPALLAALDQVLTHPWWPKWERPAPGEEPDTSWVRPPGEEGSAPHPCWTAVADGEGVIITGPWTVHHELREDDDHLLFSEICYRDVEDLKVELEKATP